MELVFCNDKILQDFSMKTSNFMVNSNIDVDKMNNETRIRGTFKKGYFKLEDTFQRV